MDPHCRFETYGETEITWRRELLVKIWAAVDDIPEAWSRRARREAWNGSPLDKPMGMLVISNLYGPGLSRRSQEPA